jgi:hypothetical protein
MPPKANTMVPRIITATLIGEIDSHIGKIALLRALAYISVDPRDSTYVVRRQHRRSALSTTYSSKNSATRFTFVGTIDSQNTKETFCLPYRAWRRRASRQPRLHVYPRALPPSLREPRPRRLPLRHNDAPAQCRDHRRGAGDGSNSLALAGFDRGAGDCRARRGCCARGVFEGEERASRRGGGLRLRLRNRIVAAQPIRRHPARTPCCSCMTRCPQSYSLLEMRPCGGGNSMTRYPALCALLVLCGCTTTQQMLIHKTGSSYAERVQAHDECKISSFQRIPQNLATEVTPGYSSPGTVQCNTIGGYASCNTVGAINIPPSAATYDVNAEIRERDIARCLAAKGYEIVPRPQCRTAAQRDAFVAARDNQPPADQISCVAGPRL